MRDSGWGLRHFGGQVTGGNTQGRSLALPEVGVNNRSLLTWKRIPHASNAPCAASMTLQSPIKQPQSLLPSSNTISNATTKIQQNSGVPVVGSGEVILHCQLQNLKHNNGDMQTVDKHDVNATGTMMSVNSHTRTVRSVLARVHVIDSW